MPKHFTLKLLCGMLVFSRNRDGCLIPPMDPAERSICWDCAPEPVPICVSPSNLPAVWTRSPLDLLGSDLSGRSLLENCQDKEFVVRRAFHFEGPILLPMGEAINVHKCSCEKWPKGYLWKVNEEEHWDVNTGMFMRVTEAPLSLNCRD